MNEQQVTVRSLKYPHNDNIGFISPLGDIIVERIVDNRVSSEAEFWESIYEIVKLQINEEKDKAFFIEPEWNEIQKYLAENSFYFNLKSNRKRFDDLFAFLCQSSNELYCAFMKDVCPPDVHKLCSRYLSAYYNLTNCLQEQNVLRDDFIYKSQFLHMLRTGYKNNVDGNMDILNINDEIFFRFFSPIFLEELRVFYSFLEEDDWYQGRLYDNKKKFIKQVYKDIIREKFNHLFLLEVTQLNDRYISTYYNVSVPRIFNRNALSSIEPIRPVRWIDKIKAYVENLTNSGKDKQNEKTIKIAAIGYVNLEGNRENCWSRELKMFYDTLSKIRIEDFSSAYDFYIDIFANSNDGYFKNFTNADCADSYHNSQNGISINVNFVDYSKLFSLRNDVKPNICYVVREYNIVLLEDVPNIYTHEYKLLKKSGKNFPDSGNDYESEYMRMDFKSEEFLVQDYRYTPINLLLSKLNLISMNEETYGDTLKYKLNQPLIDYLKDYVESLEKDNGDRNVYIFTSKKSGVDFLDYAQRNFAREERYNAKSFYLIAMSNCKSKALQIYQSSEKKSFMVFSLWNMLKNIDYSFIESEAFFNDILHCKREEVCALAMKIYIKMTWNLPDKKFLFEICFDSQFKNRESEPDRRLLKSLLEELFEVIFSSKTDQFTRCVRRSFLNSVYNQMEYIDDAILYCILFNGFSEKDEPLREVRFAEFDERYVYSVNQPVFWSLISILKLLNENVYRRDRILEIKMIYENDRNTYSSVGLDSLNVLFQCVKNICEKYGYTFSNIYRNLANHLS